MRAPTGAVLCAIAVTVSTTIDQAIKLKPPFMYLAYYGKGLALLYRGKYQEAQVAFEQAVTLKADYAAAWLYQTVNPRVSVL